MRLFIAKTLADRGRQAVAAQILLHWTQDEEKPTVADLGGVVEVARAIGDPTLLWRMLPIILSKRDALPAQAFYVEALAHDSGDAAIVAARDSIPRAILDARPLFAARLALRTGDQRQALRKLMSLRLADLPARDQRAWVALLEAATSPDVALAILLDRRRKGQLPRTLLPSAAELAGRLGQSGEQMTILNELARL
jgi:hypothetical protein